MPTSRELSSKTLALLKRLYESPKSASCFTGPQALLKAARKQDPNVTPAEVKHFLSGQYTYTLHRHTNRRFGRLKFRPAGLNTDYQADLAQLDRLAKNNSGYRYILVLVEVLSRRLAAAPLKTKSADDVKKALDGLFEDLPAPAWKIITDQGREFKNAKVKKLLEGKYKTRWTSTFSNPRVKAAVAERMVRTLKERLFRYFTETNTQRWIDILPHIVDAINRTPNRTTGFAPVDVTYKNARSLWYRLYGRLGKCGRRPRFQEGAAVRVAKEKHVFEKGYLPRFTDEVFFVAERRADPGEPVVYRLRDEEGEPVKGWFYEPEMCAVDASNIAYRVERIIEARKRGKGIEYLVKWYGFDDRHNAWVPEEEFVDL
jgi:transposase InsO family protein